MESLLLLVLLLQTLFYVALFRCHHLKIAPLLLWLWLWLWLWRKQTAKQKKFIKCFYRFGTFSNVFDIFAAAIAVAVANAVVDADTAALCFVSI